MAITRHEVQTLAELHKQGKLLRKVAMLGRCSLRTSATDLRSILGNTAISPTEIATFTRSVPEYADDLFKLLGYETIDSIDNSSYENANLLHDMNTPVPAEWKGRYDLVVDGGTLEHVFNFPVALKNMMELVRVGGYVLIHSPTNNMCGHGFYQFSPELFHRALDPTNGFHIEHVRIFASFADPAAWDKARVYDALDPAATGRRLEWSSTGPVLIQVLAQRIAELEIFAQAPQQSDYVSAWQGKAGSTAGKGSVLRRMLKAIDTNLPQLGYVLRGLRPLSRCAALKRRYF